MGTRCVLQRGGRRAASSPAWSGSMAGYHSTPPNNTEALPGGSPPPPSPTSAATSNPRQHLGGRSRSILPPRSLQARDPERPRPPHLHLLRAVHTGIRVSVVRLADLSPPLCSAHQRMHGSSACSSHTGESNPPPHPNPPRLPSAPYTPSLPPVACSLVKFGHAEEFSRGTRDNNEKSHEWLRSSGPPIAKKWSILF